MSLHACSDITEAIVLESSLGLYLKPVSKIKINVQLPKMKVPGQSISSWNVMEKLKAAIRPDQFLTLKSLKITSTVIKFEGELETKSSCERALARLRASGNLKLSGFPEKLQVRAAHAPCSGPTRHDWEAFYRDAKGVNEMKPGERPDTIHLQDIPVRWFASSSKYSKPSDSILKKAFSTFGRIRMLEVPTNDCAIRAFGKKSSLHDDLLFEVYIQYEEYVEFSIAMDSLRDKKLLYKDPDGKVYSADIKVDFDRTNYLSERCIKRRAAELKKDCTDSSNESDKHFNKCDTLLTKPLILPMIPRIHNAYLPTPIKAIFKEEEIINEEKLLLRELLLKVEKFQKFKEIESKIQLLEERKSKKQKEKLLREKEKLLFLSQKKKREKLIEQERLLKEKLLRNLRLRELQKVSENREKLRKELTHGKVLKSVLAVKRYHSSCGRTSDIS